MRFGGGFRMESANGLVTAGILGLIEGAVGKGEDFFVVDVDGRIHIPRESGPTDGDGTVQRKACTLDLEGFAGNSGENTRGERGGFLALAKSGDNEELFTTPTNQDVGIANRGTDASSEIDEHLIASVMAETVVDLFEVVGVNQIENDVAIAAAAGGVGGRVGANSLADVAGDGGLKVTAVASSGERIGERHLLEFFVGFCKSLTALGHSFLEAEALTLQLARAVVDKEIEREEAEKNGEAASVPALPPGRDHDERKVCRETESAASGAAGDGEVVVTGRKSGIASLAARGFIGFGFQASEAIGAADILGIAVGKSGESHTEVIVAAQSFRIALAKAIARAELRGSDHDARREFHSFVSGDGIVAGETAAGSEEQGAIVFREKAALAEVVPDQPIGAGEAKRVAVAEKFGEAVCSAGPNVTFMIGAEHVDVERGQAVCQAKVREKRIPVDEAQAAQTQSIGIAKPDFIAADGGGFHNLVLQQAIGGSKVEPMFSIKAGEAAPADRPQNAISGGCKAADALVDFRRQRNVDEVKRA